MKTYLRHTWADPALYSAQSPIHGTGIFTKKPIQKGEVIMIWGGLVINRNEYDATREKYRSHSVVPIDDEHYLGLPIEDEGESLDEHLNHSCDGNTWLNDEVTMAAARDIAAGEELTMDSALWNDDASEQYSDDDRCTCGVSDCRGKVTADDWKIPAIQNRYNGHFSPYLQTRIDAMRQSKGN